MNYIEFRKQAPRTMSSVTEIYGEMNPVLEHRLNLLHCIIGIDTEVDEFEQAIDNDDSVNAREELGDMLWYMANYENLMGYTMENLQSKIPEFPYEIQTFSSRLKDYFKKKIYYNTDKYDEEIKKDYERLKVAVIDTAHDMDISLNEAMSKVISKLRKRYPNKFSTKSSDNRDLIAERRILED
jgi:NTP pyrophosphatase (non-canonical NTP hydrolase)